MSLINNKNWTKVEGSHLQYVANDGIAALDGYVPASSGIYMWKLNTLPSDYLNISVDDLVSYIDDRCYAPIGKVGPNHHGRIFAEGYEIRGTRVPREKREHLVRSLKRNNPIRAKTQLINLLSELRPHTPSLYVGQAADLQARLLQHLQGLTDFGNAVLDGQELSFESLDFWFYQLPTDPTFPQSPEHEIQTRKTLEYIVTMYTLGGHTKRAG